MTSTLLAAYDFGYTLHAQHCQSVTTVVLLTLMPSMWHPSYSWCIMHDAVTVICSLLEAPAAVWWSERTWPPLSAL